MKIVTVCGNGCGTSLLLKMTIENVAREEKWDVEVEHTDLNSALSISCDFLMASDDIVSMLEDTGKKCVTVSNILDKNEVKNAILSVMEKKG